MTMRARRSLVVLPVLILASQSRPPAAEIPAAARSAQSRSAAAPQASQKAEIAGRDGVTVPKVLHEVQPRYTAEATRRGIQGAADVECLVLEDGTVGAVRVVGSIDPNYGLDQEALKAARQWRFTPATKDSVPVRATMVIQLRFRLGNFTPPQERADLAWPAVFPTEIGQSKTAGEWIEKTLEAAGLELAFTYPSGWSLRTAGPAGNWFDFVSPDFTRLVVVSQPIRSEGPGLGRMSPGQAQRRVQDMAAYFAKSGSAAVVHGVGQAEAAGVLWTWTDYSAPAGDPEVALRFRSRAFGTQGRVRLWHFTGNTAGHFVGIFFRVADRDGPADTTERAAREAAAEFRAILAYMSFRSK